jgi:hypothetical protein
MSCFVDLPYSCLRCDQGESSRERWSSVGRVSSLGTQGTTGQTHSYFGFVLLLFSVWRAPVPEDPLRDFPCAPSGQARSFLECLSQAALPPEHGDKSDPRDKTHKEACCRQEGSTYPSTCRQKCARAADFIPSSLPGGVFF